MSEQRLERVMWAIHASRSLPSPRKEWAEMSEEARADLRETAEVVIAIAESELSLSLARIKALEEALALVNSIGAEEVVRQRDESLARERELAAELDSLKQVLVDRFGIAAAQSFDEQARAGERQ